MMFYYTLSLYSNFRYEGILEEVFLIDLGFTLLVTETFYTILSLKYIL